MNVNQLTVIDILCHSQFPMSSPENQRWKRWQREFPWLVGKFPNAKCTCCVGWRCQAWQRWQLVQHETSKMHRAKGSCSPSVAEFQTMFQERVDGTSLRQSSAGSFRSLKMLWCTSEAIKDLIKKRIRKVITASISQDGQGSTVGIRMCVVSHGLRRLTS